MKFFLKTFFLKPFFLTLVVMFSLNLFAEDVAIVRKISGSVFLGDQKLKVGDSIKIGSLIDASSKGSFIDLEIPGNGKIRLVGGLMKVRKITSGDSLYELIKGKIFTYFKSDKERERELRIMTNEGSFAVRGTKFAVIKEEDYKSTLCVCEGEVEAKNNYGVSGVVRSDQALTFSGVDREISSKIENKEMTKLRSVFSKMGL